MSLDELEMTYAFYMEAEDFQFSRLERILGTTWVYSDVASMRGDEAADKEVRHVPQDQKLFYPLMLGLNPNLIKEVKARFGVGALHSAFGDEGFDDDTQSMFSMPKEAFLRKIGAKTKEDTDELDLSVAKPQRRSR
jgi:hypothetical protein